MTINIFKISDELVPEPYCVVSDCLMNANDGGTAQPIHTIL